MNVDQSEYTKLQIEIITLAHNQIAALTGLSFLGSMGVAEHENHIHFIFFSVNYEISSSELSKMVIFGQI